MSALAGHTPTVQSRGDAQGRNVSTHHVTYREPHEYRRLTLGSGHAHAAAHGLHDTVESRSLAVRTFLTKGGQRTGDHRGIHFLEGLVIEPQAIKHRGAEGVEDHVGDLDQSPKHLLALLLPQVDGDALFVAVEIQVVGALAAQEVRPDTAGHIAHARLLHLDHLGPHVGQGPGGERPGDGLGHLQNTNALKGLSSHQRSAFSYSVLKREANWRTSSICSRESIADMISCRRWLLITGADSRLNLDRISSQVTGFSGSPLG